MSEESLKPIVLALPSISPSLAIEVLPYGLTFHRILVNGDGKTHDLLIGPHDKREHALCRTFFHTIVGRYANRIPSGESTVEKDGVESQLSIEPTESPQVSLHGGADGFDKRVWELIDTTSSEEAQSGTGYHLFSDAEKKAIKSLPAAAIFKLTSPAGDQGYPGELYVEVLLGLTEPSPTPSSPGSAVEQELGSVIVVYRAKLADASQKVVTPVNLTQHWGFNLDASLVNGPGEPTPDVMTHVLTIKAGKTIAVGDNFLATGELTPVAGTAYEHTQKPIGLSFPPKGYDEYYMFDAPNETSPSRLPLSSLSSLNVVGSLLPETSSKEEVPVTLASKRSGLRLTFETNQPGVQLYTANSLHGQGSRKRIHGGSAGSDDGDGYQAGASTFLEFHEPHAAWLHPWGQAPGKDTLLLTGELYNNYTKLNVYFKPVAAE